MVSKASEDLPDPESPVKTVRVFRGISTVMFLRLCSRAPRTMRASLDIAVQPTQDVAVRSILGARGRCGQSSGLGVGAVNPRRSGSVRSILGGSGLVRSILRE